MYRIDIMTLFPDVVGDMLCESILGRGQERGYIRIECHQIRGREYVIFLFDRQGTPKMPYNLEKGGKPKAVDQSR